VDARTDVFALSIVLWEMLAMRRLFQGDNEVDTIQRVKNCRIDHDLRQLNPEVDEDLDGILKKGLAKDPKRRYRTAGDFEKDLRRYMSRKYPEFTPEDLGNFLKKSLESRRNESAADIKKTLTESNLRGAPQASSSSSSSSKRRNEGRKRSVDLSLEDNKGPAISVVRQTPLPANPLAARSNVSNISGPGRATAAHGRFGYSPSTGQSFAASRRNRADANRSIMMGAVAAVALILVVAIYQTLAAKSDVGVMMLRTQPSRVKVWVDNQAVQRGRYVRATDKNPLKLTMRPGQHEITVSRLNYQTYKYPFTIEAGEKITKDDVVLKEKAPLAAIKIRTKNSDGKVLKIDIADGYYVASFIPGKVQAVGPDLQVNKAYIMRVILNSQSEKDFTCKIVPRSTNWRQPNEVVIDRKARRCPMSGP
jgi:hypothetical protein